MLAVFYMFNKRKNSLKTPTTADISISGEVLLKQSTSIHEPVFIMAVGEADMFKARESNYCSWNNTLYWVEDVIITSNTHVEFHCKEDVLGTYKNEILLTTAYIVRSSNKGLASIVDEMITPRTNSLLGQSAISLDNDIFTDKPRFQIGIMNNAQGKNYLGAPLSIASYYQLDYDQVKDLKDDLMNPNVFDQLKQFFAGDLFSSIVSTQLTCGYISTSSSNIKINDIELPTAQGRLVTSGDNVNKTYTIDVNSVYSDFRKRSPYTQAELYLPFVGIITLDMAKLYNFSVLTIEVHLEIITGGIIYEVYGNVPNSTEALVLFGTYSGCCSSDLPIARSSSNISGLLAGTIQMASGMALSVATAHPVTTIMGMSSFASGVNTFMEGMRQTIQTGGSMSTAVAAQADLSIQLNIWSCATSCNPIDLNEKYGNPCHAVYRINELTGYCQTQGFSLSALATAHELDEVNALMDGGVYIE